MLRFFFSFFIFLVSTNVLILTLLHLCSKKTLQIQVFISQIETDSVYCIY